MLLSPSSSRRFVASTSTFFSTHKTFRRPLLPASTSINNLHSSSSADLKLQSHHPPTVCDNASTNIPTSAYIHLPFCKKRCHYCDFPIVALGTSFPSPVDNDPRILNYTQLVCKEISSANTTRHNSIHPLQTVFFGGGTPSLTPPKLLSLIIQTLRDEFRISPEAEISMEIDPGTFDADSLSQYIELGVNRVSLGVQAFQDESLKLCGRSHQLQQVYESIDIIHNAKLSNWSIDLISSLPHQNSHDWEHSLTEAIRAQPSHISVYDLQIEKGTKFGNLYQHGEFPLPNETKSADFYKMASEILRANGYEHYEISNYSKKGFECKHNMTYWMNKPYYAFGLGSTSYVNGLRFTRARRMKDYAEFVEGLVSQEVGCEESSSMSKEKALDVVMLSLRLARGLDVVSFGMEFGWDLAMEVCNALAEYVESRHVVALDAEKQSVDVDEFIAFCSGERDRSCVRFIRLSDPEGFLLSNELITMVFRVISP